MTAQGVWCRDMAENGRWKLAAFWGLQVGAGALRVSRINTWGQISLRGGDIPMKFDRTSTGPCVQIVQ